MTIDKYEVLRSLQSLSVDAKKRLDDKLSLQKDKIHLPDPYALKGGWKDEPEEILPNLKFGDIYLYLIDTFRMYTKEYLKVYTSLDGYK